MVVVLCDVVCCCRDVKATVSCLLKSTVVIKETEYGFSVVISEFTFHIRPSYRSVSKLKNKKTHFFDSNHLFDVYFYTIPTTDVETERTRDR